MSKIEERIVKMVFDNKEFEKNVDSTKSSLNDLKTQLKLDGIADSVQTIADRFSTWGIVGMEVIGRLTNAAMDLGKTLASATIGQITTGGKKRALNLEQAYFQLEGLKMDAQAIIDDVSFAVDGTAYGLDEAAKVAAQFGASGMQAGDDMAHALRAVSGVAAMTGGSYEDIGRVFIKVAGNGRLMGQELLQLSGRGINAAATLAKQLGKSEAEVRAMVSKGQIDFKTFYEAMYEEFGEHAAKANETFTGSFSNMKAALSRIGATFYTPFLKNARDVFNVIRPVIDGVHEALKVTFAPYIIDRMKSVSEWIVKLLAPFQDKTITGPAWAPWFDGLTKVLQTLESIVKRVITPVKEAFQSVFNEAGPLGSGLSRFADLLKIFEMSDKTAEKFKNTLVGLFKGIKFLWEFLIEYLLLEQIWTTLEPIVKLVKDALFSIGSWLGKIVSKFVDWNSETNGFYNVLNKVFNKLQDWTWGFAELIYKFKDWLQTSPKVRQAFETIKTVMSSLWEVFKTVGKYIGNIFSGLIEGAGAFATAVKEMFKKSDESAAKSTFITTLSKLWEVVKAITGKIWEVIKELAKGISNALGGINFDTILKAINTISLATIAASIKKFFGGGGLLGEKGVFSNFKEMLQGITPILDGVRGALEAWTLSIKADALMKIAGAVGVLALSLIGIATINPERLASSIAAITLLFTDLMAAMGVMNKMQSGGKGGLTGVFDAYAFKTMSKSLVYIAAAVAILAVALRMVAKLDEESAMRGVMIIGALTTILVLTVKALEKVKPERLKTIAASVILISTALVIMSSAVKKLAKLEWDELQRGLTAVGVLLLELALFTKLVGSPERMISMGIGFNLIGASLLIFYSAVKKFAVMEWEELGKGFAAIGGALLLMVGAIRAMPEKGMLSGAASIMMISQAMLLMVIPLKQFAKMTWEQIAKGMVVLGGAMLIFALGLRNMEGTLPASAALLIAVAAFGLLVPILKAFGNMSWSEIIKAITVMAVSLGLLTAAGYAMKPVILIVHAAALAMVQFGAGLTLVGIGLVAIAAGLTALSGTVTASAKLITTAIQIILKAIIDLIPDIVVAIGEGLIAILVVIKNSVKTLVETVVAVVVAVLQGLAEAVPEFVKTLGVLLDSLLPFIVEYVPKLINALIDAIINTLKGLSERLPDLIKIGVEVVVGIIKGIAASLDDIVDALITLLVSAVNAIAKGIRNATSGIAEAIGNLIMAFIGLFIDIFKELFGLATSEEMLPIIESLGLTILALAGAMALAAAVAPAGLAGALVLVEFIGILALILAALGGLSKIPGVKDLLESGGELLATLGYAIGNFLGSIIGGFGAGITSGLPVIGENLSLFMTNLQPFIDGAKQVTPGVMDGVKDVVGIILALTAASLLEGIAKFFGATTDFGAFGEQLATFGEYFAKYYSHIKDVKPEIVKASASAAGSLAELNKSLPKKGGLMQSILGSSDLSTFGESLEVFGTSLLKYQQALGTNIKPALIQASATAALALVELEQKLPKHGGMKSWFAGDAKLSEFGEQLKDFGKAIKDYQESLGKDIDGDLIVNSANAALALAELEGKLPKHGGVKSWFMGDNDLGKFGANLKDFGTALRGYYDALGTTMDGGLIESSANAALALAELEASLPDHGGMKGWFSGEADLKTFGENLVPFAEGMAEFQEALGEDGINADLIQSGANAAMTLAKLNQELPETGGVVQAWSGSKDLGKFAKELGPVGEGLLAFQNSLSSDINAPLIQSAANAALTLAEMNQNLPETGGLVEAWSGKGQDLAAFAQSLPPFGEGLAKFQESLGDGIDAELIQSAANAGLALSEIEANRPSFGGLVTIWSGEQQTLEQFGDSLVAFGTALAEYGEAVKELNVEAIMASVDATAALVDIANNLEGSVGGLKALWSSDYTLKHLGNDLSSLGNSLGVYGESIKDLDTVKMESVSTILEKLVSLANGMASITQTSPMTLFGNDLKRMGEAGLDGFTSAFENSETKVNASVYIMLNAVKLAIEGSKDDLETAMTSTVGVMKSAMEDTALAAKTEGGKITLDFFTAIKDGFPLVQAGGRLLLDKFKEALDEKNSDVKNALTDPVSKGITLIRNYYRNFYETGAYLVEGFVKGIQAKTPSAETAGKTLGKKTAEATKRAIDARSPSRLFYEIGSFAGEGFVGALNVYAEKAEDAGTDLAESSMIGLSSALDLAKAIMNEDTDATIRPILDLSDIYNKTNEINRLLEGKTYSSSLAHNTSGSVQQYRTAITAGNSLSRLEDYFARMPNSTPGNQYNINIKVEGEELSHDRLREIAITLDKEIKRIDDELIFSRGGSVNF